MVQQRCRGAVERHSIIILTKFTEESPFSPDAVPKSCNTALACDIGIGLQAEYCQPASASISCWGSQWMRGLPLQPSSWKLERRGCNVSYLHALEVGVLGLQSLDLVLQGAKAALQLGLLSLHCLDGRLCLRLTSFQALRNSLSSLTAAVTAGLIILPAILLAAKPLASHTLP